MSVQKAKHRSNPRPQSPDHFSNMATLRASARQVIFADVDTEDVDTEDVDIEPETNRPVRRRRFHKGQRGLMVLAGMLVLLGGYLLVQMAVIPAYDNLTDQWNYGDARITQMDADVGHGGVSHFLAEYYKGNILLIEISLSNPSNAHIYTLSGMMEHGTNTPVILLSVEDSHHDGKPNLLIQVEGTNFATVLYNTGTAFEQSGG